MIKTMNKKVKLKKRQEVFFIVLLITSIVFYISFLFNLSIGLTIILVSIPSFAYVYFTEFRIQKPFFLDNKKRGRGWGWIEPIGDIYFGKIECSVPISNTIQKTDFENNSLDQIEWPLPSPEVAEAIIKEALIKLEESDDFITFMNKLENICREPYNMQILFPNTSLTKQKYVLIPSLPTTTSPA
jgi:hypothetical protein